MNVVPGVRPWRGWSRGAVGLLFDFAAVHLIGEKAGDVDVRIDFTFTDLGEDWTMWIRSGVLNARPGHVDDVQLTVSGPKPALVPLVLQPGRATELLAADGVTASGDLSVFETLASIFDTFNASFNMATP